MIAVVSVDTEEYYREWSLRNCDCDCDYTLFNGRTLLHHVKCTFQQHVNCGSQIEILGVFDGVDSDGLARPSPTSETGMIWARHYFETGWIPVKHLLPMDIVVQDKIIQTRILRASRVSEAVRFASLLFSPHNLGPVPRIGSKRNTMHSEDHELWETDSLGNFLFDIDEPDAEYLC